MTSLSVIKLYEFLSIKLGKETAENLTGYIDEKIKDAALQNLKACATREDLVNTQLDPKNDISVVRTEVSNTKADMVRWMFLFWIGQLIATFSFILLFLKR